MGLDMFAYKLNAEALGDSQVNLPDEKIDKAMLDRHFYYWRKHHSLHNWMHNLYVLKGGKNKGFNCDTVRLMPEDLNRLEADIKGRALPETSGFFFGNNEPDAESDARDLAFVEASREAIARGEAVVYDSWW